MERVAVTEDVMAGGKHFLKTISDEQKLSKTLGTVVPEIFSMRRDCRLLIIFMNFMVVNL